MTTTLRTSNANPVSSDQTECAIRQLKCSLFKSWRSTGRSELICFQIEWSLVLCLFILKAKISFFMRGVLVHFPCDVWCRKMSVRCKAYEQLLHSFDSLTGFICLELWTFPLGAWWSVCSHPCTASHCPLWTSHLRVWLLAVDVAWRTPTLLLPTCVAFQLMRL